MPVVPLVLVLPGSTDEVSEVLRLASEHGVPVVARGSGTGLSGAAVPVADGILLAFDRMKRILEIDTENQVAVVEPGVTLEQLNGELAPLGPDLPGVAGRAERLARRERRHQRGRHARRPLRRDASSRARARGRAGRRHGPAHRRQVRQVLERLRPDPAAHRLRGHPGHHDRGDGEARSPGSPSRRPCWPPSPRCPRWPTPCRTSCRAASTRPSSSTSTSW